MKLGLGRVILCLVTQQLPRTAGATRRGVRLKQAHVGLPTAGEDLNVGLGGQGENGGNVAESAASRARDLPKFGGGPNTT